MESNLQQSRKVVQDLQASNDNMRFQGRQQAALMNRVRHEFAETIQNRALVKEQLEAERHLNAQLMAFIEALSFLEGQELKTLVDHKVDFDVVLASHPTIARRVTKVKQAHVAKKEALERFQGMHQQFVDMIQRLDGYARESDDEEAEMGTATAGV